MDRRRIDITDERGQTIIEFAFAASIFFMMLVGIVAGGVFFWTHNALVESTRRGARFATLRENTATDAEVKNVVVYGKPTFATGDMPLVPNLVPANVTVVHSVSADPSKTFGVGSGTVTVEICQNASANSGCTPYSYAFNIPSISEMIQMPPYRTTMPGESAGLVPPDK